MRKPIFDNQMFIKVWQKLSEIVLGSKDNLRSFLFSINERMYKDLNQKALNEIKFAAKSKKKYNLKSDSKSVQVKYQIHL